MTGDRFAESIKQTRATLSVARTRTHADIADWMVTLSKTAGREAKAAAKAKEKAEEKEKPKERTKLDGNPVLRDRRRQCKRMTNCMHEFIVQG